MPRIPTSSTPTEQDIRGYNNVPLEVAAQFIGWSSATIRKALIQERAPFGMAVQTGTTESTGRSSYAYNISPGLLIKYKNGELPTWRLNEVLKLAADGIEDILDQRMGAVAELFTAWPTEGRGRRRRQCAG